MICKKEGDLDSLFVLCVPASLDILWAEVPKNAHKNLLRKPNHYIWGRLLSLRSENEIWQSDPAQQLVVNYGPNEFTSRRSSVFTFSLASLTYSFSFCVFAVVSSACGWLCFEEEQEEERASLPHKPDLTEERSASCLRRFSGRLHTAYWPSKSCPHECIPGFCQHKIKKRNQKGE